MKIDEKTKNKIFYKYLRWEKYDDLSVLAEQYDITVHQVRRILYDIAQKKGVKLLDEKKKYRERHKIGLKKRSKISKQNYNKSLQKINSKRKKFSDADIRYILKNPDCLGCRKLAKKFQVNKSTIQSVQRRKTYKHIKIERTIDEEYISDMNKRFQEFMKEKYKTY